MKKQFTFLLIVLVGLSINESIAQSWGWVKYPGCDVSAGNGADYGVGIDIDQNGNVYNCGYFKHTAFFDGDSVVSAGEKDIYIAKYSNSGNLIWVKRFGGDEDELGTKIQIDSAGNIYVFCGYQGTFSVGSFTLPAADSTAANSGGSFIVKLDNSGNVIWVQVYSSDNVLFGSGEMQVDKSGNIYLLTEFDTLSNQFAFLRKIDTNGNTIWAQDSLELGNAGLSSGLCLDSLGNIYVTGIFVFGSPPHCYVAKLNNAGAFIFKKTVYNTNSTNRAAFNDIAVDNLGNIFVSGNLSGSYSFAANSFTSVGSIDLFVGKFDSQGNQVWGFSGGGLLEENSFALNIDNANNVIVQAEYKSITAVFGNDTLNNSTSTFYNIVMLKFSNSGTLQWTESSGYNIRDDRAADMDIDDNDNLYLSGYLQLYGNTNYFGNTLIIANVNNNDNILLTVFHSTPTGINDVSFGNFPISVYPNPFTNQLVINGTNAKGEVVIYNSLGKIIMKQRIGIGETKIQTEGFSSGIYLLQCKEQNNTANFKLLKF